MSKDEEEKHRIHDWMVRPCMIYKGEYDDCTSMKARFNQYFIFGKMLECDQWNTDYYNCYQWQKHKSKKAYDELIASEKRRRIERLGAHMQNDVWQRREKPPDNWNAPLPDWMQKEFENTYLEMRSKEMKEGNVESPLEAKCTIM